MGGGPEFVGGLIPPFFVTITPVKFQFRTVINLLLIFSTTKNFKNLKIAPQGAVGGGPDIFFGLESLHFCELGAHAKF